MTVSAIHHNMGRAGQMKPHKAKTLGEFLIVWRFSGSCDAQGCPLITSIFSLDPLTPDQHDNITVWLLPPPTPSRTTMAHPPITARAKPSSTQDWCHFGPGREILEQIAGTSSRVTLSIYLQRTVGAPVIYPAAPVSILWFMIDIFLYIVTPDYSYFPLPPKPD